MNAKLCSHVKRIAAAAIVLTLVSGGVTSVPFADLSSTAILNASADVDKWAWGNSDLYAEWDGVTDTLTFIGTGTASFPYQYRQYKSYVKKIIFSDGITSIGSFSGCYALTSVEFADSVTEIGNYAFEYCRSLTSVAFPSNLTTIGTAAFSQTSLENTLSLPNSVTSIGSSAFAYTNITSVAVPKDVESIANVFSGCFRLESVSLPNGLTDIESAFNGCTELTSVTVPATVTSMDYAFNECTKLETVNIPDGVTSISYTFSNCTSLKTVSIPDGITNMEGTFDGCSNLETASIPDGVTTIKNAFRNCSLIKSVDIPSSVVELSQAFSNCTSLENVKLESTTMTSFTTDEYSWDVNTFANCTSLKSIDLPESITIIDNGVFSGCTGLTSITLPENLTEIGSNAFSDSGLTSISFPETLTIIGDSAFNECDGLTSATFPANVTEIRSSAFYGCTQLKDITFESEGDHDTFFGFSAFGSLTADDSIEIPRRSRGGQQLVTYSTYINPDSEFEYSDENSHQYFGDAKVTIRDNGITYTYVYKPSTCTETGIEAHYAGSDGKFYRDSQGYELIEEATDESYFITEPNGHSYSALSWKWKKLSDGDDYTATVTVGCMYGDTETFDVVAPVQSDELINGTYYWATAQGEEPWYYVSSSLFIESTTYTVSVEGTDGYITEATKKDSYRKNDCVTVTANDKSGSKSFIGWYVGDKCVSQNTKYTFFVSEDVTLTPKYADTAKTAEVVTSLSVNRGEDIRYYKQKIQFVYEWSLPKGYTFVEAGIIRAYDIDVTNLTPSNAAANGAKVNKSSIKKANGKYSLAVNMSYETKQKTVNAKGYIICKNKSGKKQTIMTNMQVSAYDNY